jgi:adenine-specific DNA glycosylase
LWSLAEELVTQAAHLNSSRSSRRKEAPTSKSEIGNRKSEISKSLLTSAATTKGSCSAANQSLMELGALVCAPRNPQCQICPVKSLCVAFKEDRTTELPNLGKRDAATARRFVAFAIENNGKFLVRQRPDGVVNAHLWEFPNIEVNGDKPEAREIFKATFGIKPGNLKPLQTVKHSITRYRITLETFLVHLGGMSSTNPILKKPERGPRGTWPSKSGGVWKTPAQMERLAFTSAQKKVLGKLPGASKGSR